MPKIEKFYPLTPEVSQKLRAAKLTAAEWRLWAYLIEIDPWGEKYKELPATLTIMEEVGIKKTTFYKAIGKFQQLELFDFQDKGFNFRNLKGIPEVKKSFRENEPDSEKTESIPKKRKTFRENEPDSEKTNWQSEKTENRSPEPAPNKTFKSPQTIKTYLDFIRSLSEEERENFICFVMKQIEKFERPIADLTGWLSSSDRYLMYYNLYKAEGRSLEAEGKWENHPLKEKWLEALRSYPKGFPYMEEFEGSEDEKKAFSQWAFANELVWRKKQ